MAAVNKIGHIAVGCCVAVWASMAGAMTLDNLYNEALVNDPTYQAAVYAHQASQESYIQARAGLLPEVMLDYTLRETSQDVVQSDNTVFQSGSADYGTNILVFSVRQPLLVWSNWMQLRQGERQKLLADAELERAQQELMLRSAEVYFDVLARKNDVVSLQAEHDAAERQSKQADARVRMGLARKADQLDAQARLANVRAQLYMAQNRFDDALQGLQELVGRTVEGVAALSSELELLKPEPADIEHWAAGALEQNLSVQIKQHAVDVADYEVRKQKSGHYPTLNLVAQHTQNETDGSLFGGGSETENTDISLQLRIPIYSGGSVKSRRVQAASRHQAVLQELSQEKRRADRQVRAAYMGVESAIERIAAMQQAVDSQRLAVNTKIKGFESGLYTSIAVLDATRDLEANKRDYAQARYDYLLNTMRLKQAAGLLQARDVVSVSAALIQPEPIVLEEEILVEAVLAEESEAVVVEVQDVQIDDVASEQVQVGAAVVETDNAE